MNDQHLAVILGICILILIACGTMSVTAAETPYRITIQFGPYHAVQINEPINTPRDPVLGQLVWVGPILGGGGW